MSVLKPVSSEDYIGDRGLTNRKLNGQGGLAFSARVSPADFCDGATRQLRHVMMFAGVVRAFLSFFPVQATLGMGVLNVCPATTGKQVMAIEAKGNVARMAGAQTGGNRSIYQLQHNAVNHLRSSLKAHFAICHPVGPFRFCPWPQEAWLIFGRKMPIFVGMVIQSLLEPIELSHRYEVTT